MSFRPRVSSLKRHSLANVAEAWKGMTHGGRRLSMTPSFRMSAGNALEFASKNEILESIQVAVIQLFQKKKLQECELPVLQETLRTLLKTEAGPFIYDFYKDKLLKKGMVILREGMKNDLGSVLLAKMSEQWEYFFAEILPVLQVLFQPLQTKDSSIRKITLLEFRDVVVLKVGMEETLSSVKREEVPPAIVQMLLILQTVHDGYPPSETYARLERLVARVVSPYLGFFGLYEGSPVPKIKVALKPVSMSPQHEKTEAYDWDSRPARPRSANFPTPKPSNTHIRHGNGLLVNKLLAPVKELETGRRHSIDTT